MSAILHRLFHDICFATVFSIWGSCCYKLCYISQKRCPPLFWNNYSLYCNTSSTTTSSNHNISARVSYCLHDSKICLFLPKPFRIHVKFVGKSRWE